jgi:cyanophycinase
MRLAGGPKARLVVIPTASGSADELDAAKYVQAWRERGAAAVTVLHTRSRETANNHDFCQPLAEATGVWFGGGDQSKLTAAYRGTAVEAALHGLLRRGGVIGGTSAGAAVMSGPMIAGGYIPAKLEQGFGFLPGGIVDQHFLKRDRMNRLLDVLSKNPGWFGMGIDEGTAVIVEGRTLTVVGQSYAVACLAAGKDRPASCRVLKPQDKADLIALSRAALARRGEPHPALKATTGGLGKGALIIGGGAALPDEIWRKFIQLAGGPEATIVCIPTALEDPIAKEPADGARLKNSGALRVRTLHAKRRAEADSPEFLKALQEAGGIWFTGGRQWRLVDAYESTAAEKAFHALLARGGVIGGTSAGASIQADYMVRGNPLGNLDIVAEGYERGFGFLKGVAIDQHFLKRKRAADMNVLIERYPQLLGIGIDESTALYVHGDVMEVMGKSDVLVYDRARLDKPANDHEVLTPGSRYDLRLRKRIAPATSLAPTATDVYCATFSIVAYDPDKEEWGCAVASKYLAVGNVVPHARAGAGAVATQAAVNIAHGPNGVALLAKGINAEETLQALKESDPRIDVRQLGIIDAKGNAVTFTGKGCMPWAGGKTGKHYACQGNILAGEKVIDEMAAAFEKATGPLAWRLMDALEAGDKAGGDKRGKQSAAIVVVRDKKGPNGIGDRYIDLRVDDHKEPVPELARILALRVKRPAD